MNNKPSIILISSNFQFFSILQSNSVLIIWLFFDLKTLYSISLSFTYSAEYNPLVIVSNPPTIECLIFAISYFISPDVFSPHFALGSMNL